MRSSNSSSICRRAPRRRAGGSAAARIAAPLTIVAALCALVAVAAATAAAAPHGPLPPAPPPSRRAPRSSTPPGEFPPLYGNYCGFQNTPCTENSFRKAPVDALDAACKRHDQCWCKSGPLDCGCDASLLESARAARKAQASAPSSSDVEAARAMAGAIVAYFNIAPCVCRERTFCVPTCGARGGCTWGGPGCRQVVSPGLGGACALRK